jgi:hypothetical protein
VTLKQHDRPIWQQGQHSLQVLRAGCHSSFSTGYAQMIKDIGPATDRLRQDDQGEKNQPAATGVESPGRLGQ